MNRVEMGEVVAEFHFEVAEGGEVDAFEELEFPCVACVGPFERVQVGKGDGRFISGVVIIVIIGIIGVVRVSGVVDVVVMV